MLISLITLICCLLNNRLIGMGRDEFKQIFLPLYPFRRAFAYLSTGLLGLTLNNYFEADLSVTGQVLSFTIPVVGYILYRQPGPDCVFFAISGRTTQTPPDNKFINWVLDKLHNMPVSILTNIKSTKSQIIQWGILAGIYRGLFIIPLTIGMSYFSDGLTLFLLPLGTLMGIIYYMVGPHGPLNFNEEGSIGRGEMLSGAVIIGFNLLIPMMLGSPS